MSTNEQKKKLLKAKIAVALHDELGRVPTKKKLIKYFSSPGNVQSGSRSSLPKAATEKRRSAGYFLTSFAVIDKTIVKTV